MSILVILQGDSNCAPWLLSVGGSSDVAVELESDACCRCKTGMPAPMVVVCSHMHVGCVMHVPAGLSVWPLVLQAYLFAAKNNSFKYGKLHNPAGMAEMLHPVNIRVAMLSGSSASLNSSIGLSERSRVVNVVSLCSSAGM